MSILRKRRMQEGKPVPFLHRNIKSDGIKDKLVEADAGNKAARALGGALVKFGPGAAVQKILTAQAESACVQTSTVVCSWYQPSRVATLEYRSTKAMNQAVATLKTRKVLGRKVNTTTSINRESKTWKCVVKVGNLDVGTKVRDIKSALTSYRAPKIQLGPASYKATLEEVGNSIRREISTIAEIESWNQPAGQQGLQRKVMATFATLEDARRVIDRFQAYLLPELEGGKISLTHTVKAKVSMLASIYRAIKRQIVDMQRFLKSKSTLGMKIYSSGGPFTTIQLVSTDQKEVARAKNWLLQILKGTA